MGTGGGRSVSRRRATRAPSVDCLVDARAELAQSLVWDETGCRLFWADQPTGQLSAVSLTSGVVQSWSLPCPIGAIALCSDGRVLVVLLDGIYLFDLGTHDLHFFAALEPPWNGNPIGGGIGADGAFWIGGAAEPAARVALDGIVTVREAGTVWGAVDVEGAWWRCDAAGSSVSRFDAGGGTLLRVGLGVTPTTCCFGGPDMRLLFVGSGRAGLGTRALDRSPAAGGIFMIPVDVAGATVRRFRVREG